MNSLLYLIIQIITLYKFVLIIYIITTWLINFNVIHTSNRFVYSVMEILYKLPFPEEVCSKIFNYLCKSPHTGLGQAILKQNYWLYSTFYSKAKSQILSINIFQISVIQIQYLSFASSFSSPCQTIKCGDEQAFWSTKYVSL